MSIWSEPEQFRKACDDARRRGQQVGFVPTMGALHEGHLRLIREAKARCDFVAVSVFVNPTQFGKNEDLSRYPRTLEKDVSQSLEAGAAGVFAPSASAMYAPNDDTRIRVGRVAEPLCGQFRPGHFEGVATVVAKLFALCGPCTAVFGRKDYQQLCVIQTMVRDLFLPVEILGIPTVRESDGLAMSSRNAYLSPAERSSARAIPEGLSAAVRAFQRGERIAGHLVSLTRSHVEPVVQSIDYVSIAEADTLRIFEPGESIGDRALIALAIRMPSARLIDNVVLGEDRDPLGAIGTTKNP